MILVNPPKANCSKHILFSGPTLNFIMFLSTKVYNKKTHIKLKEILHIDMFKQNMYCSVPQ